MEKFTRADIEQAIRDFLLVQRRRDLKLYEAMIYRIERLKECEKQNVINILKMFRKKINFSLEPELLDEISRTGKLLSFRRGEIIVQNEKYVRTIPLILKGTVKVLRVDENGSELFLYYLKDGQSCAVSLSSCLADKAIRKWNSRQSI